MKEQVIQLLEKNTIPYELFEHEAVFTIDELKTFPLKPGQVIPKNLFLRDATKKRFFLVAISPDKRADLKSLREQLHTKALSFASETTLKEQLNLTIGSVTILGILNNEAKNVEVVIDRDLVNHPCLGFHPNDNTATVFLNFADIKTIIEHHGNTITYVDL